MSEVSSPSAASPALLHTDPAPSTGSSTPSTKSRSGILLTLSQVPPTRLPRLESCVAADVPGPNCLPELQKVFRRPSRSIL